MSRNRSNPYSTTEYQDYSTVPLDLTWISHPIQRNIFRRDPLPLAFEDRRLFHPDGRSAPYRGSTRGAGTLTVAEGRKDNVPYGLSFFGPNSLAVCVRRKIRREIIFAFGKSGGGRRKPPKRNYASNIKC